MVLKRVLIGRLPPDSDLLTLISALMSEIRRSIHMTWVKGHQDQIKAYSQLSKEAQLNMSADFLATRYRLRGKLKPTPHIDHPQFQHISLVMNGIRLTSHIDSCLRYHINGYHLRRHLQSKRRWTDRTWELIDFDLFGRHYQRLDSSRQVFQTKLSHDQLPLGRMNLRRSLVPDTQIALCPCCKHKFEDTAHLFRCLNDFSITEGLSSLRKDKKFQDNRPIRRIITEGIRHWINGHSESYLPRMQAGYSHSF
jgi:hypothetical protein